MANDQTVQTKWARIVLEHNHRSPDASASFWVWKPTNNELLTLVPDWQEYFDGDLYSIEVQNNVSEKWTLDLIELINQLFGTAERQYVIEAALDMDLIKRQVMHRREDVEWLLIQCSLGRFSK